ncbi:hypothetical protein [Methylobacterium oxalidis]|uniref:Uncharacterized protein n=1 Tax=Methylobacterium oxalidis TaxID=944322 RepID=A0A512JCK9_9HYPH|nr:hypothetical protein [Methylobacterium oxalidis]GEP07686.1 hypothetical protein MOX02_57240 [Methylobacterium oxalidis]GJE35291.1 hypothetical protein LDDCCGHA_5509 [Methylobacterium oxalidis]GLS64866.1 hypothetical protein GCM10007888_32470 [Methylobacterium oxalidis]
MNLDLKPVRVATGSGDEEGRLIFADGYLVAVLVQLSDEHGAEARKWFFEAGFGQLAGPDQPTFADLDEAKAWITRRLR